MTELKTLKDLSYGLNHSPNSHAVPSELRQEAIKWIKEFRRRKYCICIKCSKNKCKCSPLFKMVHRENMMIWIKHFFNITEEDLK
jgi:hypothetical protein